MDYNVFVPQPYDPSNDVTNALRWRAQQQADAENQLKLRAWQEDRAYQLQQRQAAAANAATAKARENKLLDIYGNYGITPKVTGYRGVAYSGTGVANNPDESLFNNLVQGGFVPQAESVAKAKGELTKTEMDKLKLDAAQYDTALAKTKQFLPLIQNVNDVEKYVRMKYADPVLGPVAAQQRPVEEAVAVTKDMFMKDPTGTLSALAGLTGADIANQKFETDKRNAEIAKIKAETEKAAAEAAKAKGGAGASVFGETNEGRQLQIINEVLQGKRSPSDPEYLLAYNAQFGGKNMPAYNPNTQQMEMVRAPTTAPANVPPPGGAPAPIAAPMVNGVRPAPAVAAASAAAPVITQPPKALSAAREQQQISEEDKAKNATAALKFIQYDPTTGMTEVDKLLPKSTSGPVQQLGARVLSAFGASTEGSKAIAKLGTVAKTLTLELAGGKLGAGFSNEDRDFLLGTLGDVQDANKPVGDRIAAWETAKRFMVQKSRMGTAAPTETAGAHPPEIERLLNKYPK